MGLFAKAAAKQEPTESKSKKGTPWVLENGDEAERAALGAAIGEFVKLNRETKSIETKMTVLKTKLKNYCDKRFVDHVCEHGVKPDTPMSLANSDGQKVTYVVQEASHGVKDEQLAQLEQVIGADRAEACIYNANVFKFDPVLLAKPGVMGVLEKHLEAAIGEMVEGNLLVEKEPEELLTAESTRTFRPGMLQRLAELCGRDKVKMQGVLAAMGSCATRYVRA